MEVRSGNAPFGRPSKAEPLGLILRGVLYLFWLVTGRIVGGAPVAFEVAKELNAPLGVIVVRKLGVPFQPELAMGAVSEGGDRPALSLVSRKRTSKTIRGSSGLLKNLEEA